MRYAVSSVLVVAAFVVGCGSYPAPTQKMVSAEGAIRAAQEVGASKVPQAQLHVKLAQEQVDKAKALMQDGDNKRAEMMLMRAQADAELALSLSKEETSRAEAQQAMDQVKTLQDRLK
jgi:Domain of unknown function (DUF4398)